MNQYCPKCDALISFKNSMLFEPDEIELISIIYMLKCMKCGTTFITEPRFAKKASKKQLAQMLKDFKKIGEDNEKK